MAQTLFTVVADVDPSRLDDLKAVLAVIGADPAANAILPLGGFDTLHFASLVLAPVKAPAPTLIFENNVDGPLDVWLETLVDRVADGLDTLYGHCVGYHGEADAEKLLAFLVGHVVLPAASHVGATGRSLARICQEAELREAIEAYVHSAESAGRLPDNVSAIRSSIQDVIDANPAFSWARTSPPRKTKLECLGHLTRLVGLGVVLIALLPLWLPLFVVWIVVLHRKERTDPVQEGPPDLSHIEAVRNTEDFIAQNHMAAVIPVKPGLLRAATLSSVLYILNLVTPVIASKGRLAGIPSIHFAHWSRVNHGRHLLFLSNFDGSWESYLGDFIDKAAPGLTAVWSNTVNFPRTRCLVKDGATDGPRFRQWARANQCPTAAWYSAYPEYTMPIIDNNSSIREGLFGPLNPAQVQAWLRRL